MNLDQRSLQILTAIYQTHSVSEASRQLGIGQPAVSIALAKLRQHFTDPLFVRIRNTMEPTEAMHALYPLIQESLYSLEQVSGFNQHFNPTLSRHCFTISMTDISHIVLLPKLCTHLQAMAPEIKIRAQLIHPKTPEQMREGMVDLAVGLLPQLETGFYQQTLFNQHYICLTSQHHPRIQQQLTLEDYAAEAHIAITSSYTGHLILEKALHKAQIKRQIKLELPTFLGLGHLIEQTDLLASVPERLGDILVTTHQIKRYPLPFPIQHYTINQYWHERLHHDIRNQWLRRSIADLLGRKNQTA